MEQMDRPISMRELADRLSCDPSNVTGITDRMEAHGLVTRQAGESDRRVKRLVLTDAGRELRQRLQARLMQGPAPLVGLSEADQELLRALLLRTLGRET